MTCNYCNSLLKRSAFKRTHNFDIECVMRANFYFISTMASLKYFPVKKKKQRQNPVAV